MEKKKKLTGTVEETIVLKTRWDRQVQLVQPWTSIYTGSVIKKKPKIWKKSEKPIKLRFNQETREPKRSNRFPTVL